MKKEAFQVGRSDRVPVSDKESEVPQETSTPRNCCPGLTSQIHWDPAGPIPCARSCSAISSQSWRCERGPGNSAQLSQPVACSVWGSYCQQQLPESSLKASLDTVGFAGVSYTFGSGGKDCPKTVLFPLKWRRGTTELLAHVPLLSTVSSSSSFELSLVG